MTWTLVVLILHTTPPKGIEVTGFATKADCDREKARFCDPSTVKLLRCDCVPSQVQT